MATIRSIRTYVRRTLMRFTLEMREIFLNKLVLSVSAAVSLSTHALARSLTRTRLKTQNYSFDCCFSYFASQKTKTKKKTTTFWILSDSVDGVRDIRTHSYTGSLRRVSVRVCQRCERVWPKQYCVHNDYTQSHNSIEHMLCVARLCCTKSNFKCCRCVGLGVSWCCMSFLLLLLSFSFKWERNREKTAFVYSLRWTISSHQFSSFHRFVKLSFDYRPSRSCFWFRWWCSGASIVRVWCDVWRFDSTFCSDSRMLQFNFFR